MDQVFLSSDINFPVTALVESLQGDLRSRPSSQEDLSPALYVECALYIDGSPFGLVTRTGLAIEKPYKWNEAITLTGKYRDLSLNAQLAFTVWDVSNPLQEIAVGGSTLRLFNSKGQLKTGKQRLRLWRGRVADGSAVSTTPGKVPEGERGEGERLDKLLSKYERGDIEHIDWLDNSALKAIDKIMAEQKKSSTHIFLTVKLWSFGHAVEYQERAEALLSQPPTSRTLCALWDTEIGRENPCEVKHFKLARSISRLVIDPDLKPSSKEKRCATVRHWCFFQTLCFCRVLMQVCNSPPTQKLTSDDKMLLWKFRFYLSTDKKALTKFLRCVDWNDAQEAKQATELMHKWEPVDIPDALELLSADFESEEVRAYAVEALRKKTTAEELQCYWLQLVQALQFERCDKSPLAYFLVEKAVQIPDLANSFHWYVMKELAKATEPSNKTKRFFSVHDLFETQMLKEKPMDYSGKPLLDQLHRQTELVSKLCSIATAVKDVADKDEKLRQLLSDLTSFEELPSPLDPKIIITGIVPCESSVFTSSRSPLVLTFRTVAGGSCKVMFKKGDDLQQDQLVIQLITLMDQLLKVENLDLQLTPYRVLATNKDEGLLEFVTGSKNLQTILVRHRSIINYFRQCHPDPEGQFGISAPCLETFVKSCAGYCVITYILGVGDRHLENLLIRDDGRLFHVDFGFILGKDPKPFPPPMKLCKEMVDAMGGINSEYYGKFKLYCCEAFNILRKSSNLILNLFYLMSNSEVAILKLQEKFQLSLDDEEAIQFFQLLINESVNALFPQVVDTMHRWAQYWRYGKV
ncbi:phosphatidylinositol 3-kinase VPS34 [Selaginella moellendorffii]|uniref:phosphatidylinositol 3-kinase VPS34 n=1 Tax=Selaginella moellendorffii TaxID=88036 RepID=UPI000D1C2F56|nr:phosphatidylinositol 3-kinase VPS34 [Selaginella moellendorffii]|eukprot:XP_024518652.1 phosphatidylinositol 3-kinase VPS34 [Selaginella moellendorffii]